MQKAWGVVAVVAVATIAVIAVIALTAASVWGYCWARPIPFLSRGLQCEIQLADAETDGWRSKDSAIREQLDQLGADVLADHPAYSVDERMRRENELLTRRGGVLLSLRSAQQRGADLQLLEINFSIAPQNGNKVFDAMTPGCGSDSLRFAVAKWLWGMSRKPQ